MSLLLTLNRFHNCSGVSIVNFEQVNAGCEWLEASKKITLAFIPAEIIYPSLGKNGISHTPNQRFDEIFFMKALSPAILFGSTSVFPASRKP